MTTDVPMNKPEPESEGDGTLHHKYEDKIINQVCSDFTKAKSFMDGYHKWCQEMHSFYFNAQRYQDLKIKNKFPSTAIQEDVDMFVADARDKLFYSNRPCSIRGREEKDIRDAELKQMMMDYQDEEDELFKKFGLFLRDTALHRIAIAKVDYGEETELGWETEEVPMVAKDEQGNPILDENGELVPMIINGMLQTEKEWRLKDQVVYKGSQVEKISPLNFFITGDKQKIDDEFPIFIQSFRTNDFFKSKPYFMTDYLYELEDGGENTPSEDTAFETRADSGDNIDSGLRKTGNHYIEGYMYVDKAELYQYLIEKGKKDERDIQLVKPGEKTWIIAGVVNKKTIVQLREEPFFYRKPNIIVGFMMANDEGLIGLSLSQKIEAIQRAEEDMFGMLMTNFKLAIDPWTVLSTNSVTNRNQKLNTPGEALWVTGDVNKAIKIIEKPDVPKDIYTLLSIFNNKRKSQGGLQDILRGQGDPSAETLGEVSEVVSQASLRIRDYLREFENSFVKPLYRLRNHINSVFIDEDYVFSVAGEKGDQWITVTPPQIRTSVNFICESSSRETNRNIIIQQYLQFIQLTPLALQANQIVRLDRMMAELARSGFNISEDKINDYFPLLKLEREYNIDVDKLMFQQILMSMAQNGLMNAGGMGQDQGGISGAANPNQNMPRPVTNNQTIKSNQQKNDSKYRRYQA